MKKLSDFPSERKYVDYLLSKRIKKIEQIKNLMDNYPDEIKIILKLPYNLSKNELKSWIYDMFHLNIDLDEDSDYFEQIFYNNDLRSQCGYLIDEFTENDNILYLNLHLKNFVEGFEFYWLNIIEHSDILEEE